MSLIITESTQLVSSSSLPADSIDVMASTYYFVVSRQMAAFLTSLDLFASLVASAIHDFKHPGTNNTFAIASKSELALIYNDKSVLENYHLSEAFRVFRVHLVFNRLVTCVARIMCSLLVSSRS